MLIKQGRAIFFAALAVSGCGGDDGDSRNVVDSSTEKLVTDAAVSASKDAAGADAKAGTPVVDASTKDAALGPVGENGGEDAGIPLGGIDCTGSGESECIAASVIRSGMALSCMAGIQGLSRSLSGPPSWSVSCSDTDHELTVRLEFPVQDPGPLDLSAAANAPGALEFYVSWWNAGAATLIGSMTESSSNLQQGKLTGALTNDNTLIGTFIASWGAPAADCQSGDSQYPCKQGALRLTFNGTAP